MLGNNFGAMNHHGVDTKFFSSQPRTFTLEKASISQTRWKRPLPEALTHRSVRDDTTSGQLGL
jgi:hypothetical protein